MLTFQMLQHSGAVDAAVLVTEWQSQGTESGKWERTCKEEQVEGTQYWNRSKSYSSFSMV